MQRLSSFETSETNKPKIEAISNLVVQAQRAIDAADPAAALAVIEQASGLKTEDAANAAGLVLTAYSPAIVRRTASVKDRWQQVTSVYRGLNREEGFIRAVRHDWGSLLIAIVNPPEDRFVAVRQEAVKHLVNAGTKSACLALASGILWVTPALQSEVTLAFENLNCSPDDANDLAWAICAALRTGDATWSSPVGPYAIELLAKLSAPAGVKPLCKYMQHDPFKGVIRSNMLLTGLANAGAIACVTVWNIFANVSPGLRLFALAAVIANIQCYRFQSRQMRKIAMSYAPAASRALASIASPLAVPSLCALVPPYARKWRITDQFETALLPSLASITAEHADVIDPLTERRLANLLLCPGLSRPLCQAILHALEVGATGCSLTQVNQFVTGGRRISKCAADSGLSARARDLVALLTERKASVMAKDTLMRPADVPSDTNLLKPSADPHERNQAQLLRHTQSVPVQAATSTGDNGVAPVESVNLQPGSDAEAQVRQHYRELAETIICSMDKGTALAELQTESERRAAHSVLAGNALMEAMRASNGWDCIGLVNAMRGLSRMHHRGAVPMLLKALQKPPTLREARLRKLIKCSLGVFILVIPAEFWLSPFIQDSGTASFGAVITISLLAFILTVATIALGIAAVTEGNNADIRLAAVNAIGEIGDQQAIQPLLTMLDQKAPIFPMKYLLPSLVPCLESLGAEDEAYIDAESERIIGKMLAWDTIECRTCLALLYALRFAVTSASIASVRAIIERGLPHASDADNRRVLAAAVEVLPVIEERKRLADLSNQLLRAGSAPSFAKQELVRPVTAVPGAEEEVKSLLRPTSGAGTPADKDVMKQRQ